MHDSTYLSGGTAIDSGGFGCVFRPSLSCASRSSSSRSSRISKLMLTDNAKEEFDISNKIANVVKILPNYQKYFIVKNKICKPAKLTRKNVQSFDRKCRKISSKKAPITSKNINKRLRELSILTMPYGGVPIDTYLTSNSSIEGMYTVHTGLTELLTHGIIPMNRLNLYHSDIKDSNVLVGSDNLPRMIDWGLSVHYDGGTDIPRKWMSRPFQFNVPFSCVMFNPNFFQRFDYFASKTTITKKNVDAFCKDYIYHWIQIRGSGHYRYINDIVHLLYDKFVSEKSQKRRDILIETRYTIPILYASLSRVILEYFRPGLGAQDMITRYIQEEYMQVVDIWGFIACYVPMLYIGASNYEDSRTAEKKLFDEINRLFTKYLYSLNPVRIQLEDVTEILHSISQHITHIKHRSDIDTQHMLLYPRKPREKYLGSFAKY